MSTLQRIYHIYFCNACLWSYSSAIHLCMLFQRKKIVFVISNQNVITCSSSEMTFFSVDPTWLIVEYPDSLENMSDYMPIKLMYWNT